MAGDVEQVVDAAHPLGGGFHHGDHRVVVAQVARGFEHVKALGLQGVDRAGEPLAGQVGDGDGAAVLGERAGHAEADAAGTAADDAALAGEIGADHGVASEVMVVVRGAAVG